jgi:hypothetical protein
LFLLPLLFFLVPLASYLLILATINRRENPTMVSGAWDCIGMLLGASGALLGVGPMLMTVLYRRGVIDPDNPVPDFETMWVRHALLWVLYYVLVFSICAALIRWRSGKTIIYNVDFARLQEMLNILFQERGMQCQTLGGHLTVTRTEGPAADDTYSNLPRSMPHLRRAIVSELRLEWFPAMRHVTMHWESAEPGLREETENALRKTLPEAKIDANPAVGLLMAVSGVIMGAVMVALGFFITIQILSRR